MKSTLSLVSMIALGATSLMPVTTLAMSSFEFGNSSIASSKNLTSSAGERSQEPIKGFQGFMTAAEETVTEEVEEPIPEPELYPEILPPEPLELIDDGDRGFGQHGGWTTFPLAGFMGDFRYAPPAQIYPCEPGELCPAVQGIISAATWNFYLRKGTYDVYVTWVPFASLATNAPFTVETDRTHETILINQQNKPQGPSFQGAKWQKLGTFKISNSLSVKLINKADGHVLADAIRIVRKGDEPPPPSTFGSACWQCYGDYIGQCEATTNNNCLESEEWKMKAEESCKGHCDEETGKCGLNSFSIGEKCGSQGPICGNGICEEGERPVCPPCTPDSEVCECTIGSCPQDCDVIQECPVYMLIEPTEGCEYIWIEDENGCPLPTQECEELDEAPACAPLFSNCSCSYSCQTLGPEVSDCDRACLDDEVDNTIPKCGIVDDVCSEIKESSKGSPIKGPLQEEANCFSYTRDDTEVDYCATCGDRVCEKGEKCTPSAISGGNQTADCGPLYCPKDCNGNTPQESTSEPPQDSLAHQTAECDLSECPNGCKENGQCYICACPDDYRPVCGKDGKTYSNACGANNCGTGPGVARMGACDGSGHEISPEEPEQLEPENVTDVKNTFLNRFFGRGSR